MSSSAGKEIRVGAIVITVLFATAVAIGAGMSWIFFLRTFDPQFALLGTADLRLGQEIYNETVARTLQDGAETQEQERQQALLDADTASRRAEHTYVNETLANDTVARIQGDLNLTWGIGNETAARIASDVLIQMEIDNATTYLIQIQAFDVLSMQYFTWLAQNVSDTYDGIVNETVARTTTDALLAAQDAISNMALVVLVNLLSQETLNRTTIDDMLRTQLHQIATGGISTVNAKVPVAGDIDLNSTSAPQLTIVPGVASNEIVVTNYGVVSFNNTAFGDAVTHDVLLTADNGLVIDSPGPNTIRLYSDASGSVSTNYYQLSSVYPFGSENCYFQGCYFDAAVCHDSTVNAVRIRTLDAFGNRCVDSTLCPLVAGSDGCNPTPTGNWCESRCQVNGDCTAVYGSQWICDTSLPGLGGGFGLCRHNGGCSLGSRSGAIDRDESQCANLPQLGPYQWKCQEDKCRMMFCYAHSDCQYELGAGYHCFNGRCVYATEPFTYTVADLNNGAYDPVADGRTPGTVVSLWQMDASGGGVCACTILNGDCPQLNVQGTATPVIYSNAEPYSGFGLPCGFQSWDGQTCGFRIPGGGDSAWTIRVTVNLRVSYSTFLAYSEHFWQLHINRGNGWEKIRAMCTTSRNDISNVEHNRVYVSMSATVAMSSVGNLPYAQGQFLFVGWSVHSGVILSGNINHVPGVNWYQILYDITQVF